MIRMVKPKLTASQENVRNATGNLLVSASAGSGKTFVMIERAMKLLKEDKKDVSKFLIMTFSKASAAEMRERFVSKIYEELRENPDERLREQLEKVNFSQICTIDSFCYALFKKYYAEIGFDPAFDLLDENESRLLFVRSIDGVLEEYLSTDDKEFFTLAERFTKNRSIEPIREQILLLSRFLDVLEDEEAFLQSTCTAQEVSFDGNKAVEYYIKSLQKRFKRLIPDAEALREDAVLYNKDEYINILNSIILYLEKLLIPEGFSEMREALLGFSGFGTMPQSEKSDSLDAQELQVMIKKYKEKVTKYIRERKEEFENGYVLISEATESSVNMNKLVEITVKSRRQYTAEKNKKRKFDFADLSKIALRLLGIQRVRDDVHSLYEYVFVDEYQDTNYVQEAIIEKIAPKSLFVVGDPKQAIYQFRYAEPAIFLKRSRLYVSGNDGRAEFLNENFRSDKRVLDFINLIFDEVMSYEFGGSDYRKESRLEAGDRYDGDSNIPFAEVAYYTKVKEKNPISGGLYSVSADSANTPEPDPSAIYIAKKISALVGKETVRDAKRNESRLISYSDIAVLMKTRDADAIIAEFEKRQIPFIASGFETEISYERRLLISILKIVSNMTDDIALAAVMLSPLYGFTPDELLLLRQKNKRVPLASSVRTYKGADALREKIDTLLEDTEKYRAMSSYCTAYELMQRIFHGRFGLFAEKRGRAVREDIDSFICSVENAEFASSLDGFLEYCQDEEKASSLNSSGGNAVTLMTIHKSKGLEFPIVFVANAHKGYSNTHESKKDVFVDRSFGLAAKHFDPVSKAKTDTLIVKGFKAKKEDEEKQELLRLMYVALTRAKNHLFITGEMKPPDGVYPDDQSCFMNWILLAAKKNPGIMDYVTEITDLGDDKEKDSKEIPPLSLVADMSGLDFNYKYERATESAAKFSVTELQRADTSELHEYEKARGMFDLSTEERISEGLLYHRLLELVDYEKASLEEIAVQAEGFIAEGLIDAAAARLDLTVIERALKSDIIKLAKNSSYLREKSFMLYLPMCEVDDGSEIRDRVLVQGVIDLMILGDENIIVDFKASKSSVSDIKTRYKRQLELYAKAAQTVLNRPIHKKFVYLLGRDILIEM